MNISCLNTGVTHFCNLFTPSNFIECKQKNLIGATYSLLIIIGASTTSKSFLSDGSSAVG